MWKCLHRLFGGAARGKAFGTDLFLGERLFGPDAHARLLECDKTLSRILTENIIPFWYPGSLDHEYGGYRLNHDPLGQWKGPAPKYLVSQTRTLWFFSRLSRDGYGAGDFQQAADHGYHFLRSSLWDGEWGGFHWEVDSAGTRPLRSYKEAYGHAFALYGLSEYALAWRDPGAAAFAREVFDLLEFRFHDARLGGYFELFDRDWTRLPETEPGYLSAATPGVKLMNTHLHLLEAITSYHRLTGDPVARDRLVELILVLSNAVVRKTAGACTDRHDLAWKPIPGSSRNAVSYGHDVENISLLCDAFGTIGLPDGPLLDLYRTLFAHMLQFGYDEVEGGVYASGPINRPARDRAKVWWVQAESLLGSLHLYVRTGEAIYAKCFLEILDWIVTRQVDWQHGEWHAVVEKDGRITGDKTGPWKSPYHNTRAMLDCLDLLETFKDEDPGLRGHENEQDGAAEHDSAGSGYGG